MDPIYLDNAATTRPAKRVIAAMNRVLSSDFGNPSSLYGAGVRSAQAVREARETIAEVVGSGPWNVIFTSGGTEADTLAVLGTVPRGPRNKVVTSTLEHAAIESSCLRVETLGGRITRIQGGSAGVVDADAIEAALDRETGLVSITHLASELGTVQPISNIAARVKQNARRCLVHTDAVQALAQLPRLDIGPEVDMVTISAHKIHGPTGVGALLVRPGVTIHSIICGGDQQGGVRPGTENLPGIMGFQAAAALLATRRQTATVEMAALRDRLILGICGGLEGVRPLGDPTARAPGMVVLAVANVRSEVLLHTAEGEGLLASAGSACHATRTDPPRAVKDAGLRDNEGVLRLSLSFDTTTDEIERAIPILTGAITSLRHGKSAPR